MSNQISSRGAKRKDYQLIERYSDPLATLRKMTAYEGLLSQVEEIGKKLEKEAEKKGRVYFQMQHDTRDGDWMLLNKLSVSLRGDVFEGKTFRGVPIYGLALDVLSKEYPHSMGVINGWHDELFGGRR